MGIFSVEVEISQSGERKTPFISVGSLLVDTGSEDSWVRAELLVRAGISVRKPAQR